jgi:hypothetical protein
MEGVGGLIAADRISASSSASSKKNKWPSSVSLLQGIGRVADPLSVLMGDDGAKLPRLARQALQGLSAELEAVGDRVKQIDAAIMAWHKDNEASRRLATILARGSIRASARCCVKQHAKVSRFWKLLHALLQG